MSEDAPRQFPRRRRLATLALALVVFASGLAVGAGGATLVLARRAQQAIQHPDLQSDRVADRLKRRLNLRAEQLAQVRSILSRRQQALMRIRADVQPRVRDELLSVRDEVRGVLDPAQRQRWDVMFDELAERWSPPMPATTRD